MSCFPNRGENGFFIKWTDSAQIDHVSFDAMTRKLLGSMCRLVGHKRGRHDRDVRAISNLVGTAKWHGLEFVRYGPTHGVERAVLQDNDGAVVLERGNRQALGVARERRHDHGKAGEVRERGLKTLRMSGPLAPPLADHAPDNDGYVSRT